jgi:hypothetical protein
MINSNAMVDKTMMNLDGLPVNALPVIREFADDIIRIGGNDLESIVLAGSILTQDYIPGISDINTVIVMEKLGQDFLDSLAGFGKKFGKKKVRAPLVITNEYLGRSVDVFPIEFLEIKLIHKTIYGTELFSRIDIEKPMLRLQCERELKAKLVHLSRGYISASGDKELLLNLIIHSSSGFYPIFRSILFMTGSITPVDRSSVLNAIESHLRVKLDCLKQIHNLRSQKKPSLKPEELRELFKKLYDLTHELSLIVDETQV